MSKVWAIYAIVTVMRMEREQQVFAQHLDMLNWRLTLPERWQRFCLPLGNRSTSDVRNRSRTHSFLVGKKPASRHESQSPTPAGGLFRQPPNLIVSASRSLSPSGVICSGVKFTSQAAFAKSPMRRSLSSGTCSSVTSSAVAIDVQPEVLQLLVVQLAQQRFDLTVLFGIECQSGCWFGQ